MSDATPRTWDHTVDLLIVGSGAGAMVASIAAHDRGAEALLIEKTDRYGGSSAMSGGGLWVPNNHLMKQTPIQDSPEDAWRLREQDELGQPGREDRQAHLEHREVDSEE